MDKLLKIPVELKTVQDSDTEDLEIEGWATTTDKDRVGDIVMPEAFSEAINNYLKTPILLYMHKKDLPIGKVTDMKFEPNGIKIKAIVTAASKFAREEVIPLIKRGILNAFSIGFIPKDGRYEPKSDSFYITKGELFEISVVTVPANPNAVFSVKKNFEESPEFEQLRQQWREKTLSTTINNTEKEKETMEELKKLEEQLKAAYAKIEEQEKAIKAKEEELKAIAEQAKIAADFVNDLHKQEEEKKALEAQEKAAKEKEELVKGLEELKSAFENVKAQLEEQSKALEEAKAIAEKGAKRIEFVDPPVDNIVKDFGATLDEVFLASELTKKQVNDVLSLGKYSNLPEQVKSVALDAAFRTLAGRRIFEDVRDATTVASLFDTIELPTDIFNIPFDNSNITADWVTAGTTSGDQQLKIDPIVMQAKKLMAKVKYNYEDEADALVAVVPQIRKRLVEAMADALDLAIVQSDATTGSWANAFRGLENYASGASYTVAAAAATDLSAADIYSAMVNMGKYAFNRDGAVVLVNYAKYAELVDDPNVTTVDKFGPAATIHKGELAKVWGKPIIVSEHVSGNDTALTGKAGLVVYAPGWLLGYRTKVVVETDRDVETQQKVIVLSLRVDFKPAFALSAGELANQIVYQITNP